ncbi:MAG: helix-turn-helix domain-containing protein [Candidatus Hadarchaeota archaeon]|nr:helix-turn-helix domain-containing protein [Candidatus Hadarchaeota archaeon]
MERLRRIERKVDALAGRVKRPRPPKGLKVKGKKGAALDVMALLSIPDHLRKSALAIVRLGKATAADVAEETGRSRAIESAYLNQLVRMGYLKNRREGRTVYFQVQGQAWSTKG